MLFFSGNIALHIMNDEIRQSKDIESLWTVGPEYDEYCVRGSNNPVLSRLFKQHKMETQQSLDSSSHIV